MDRRKTGTKHHLLTDGSGRAPMAVPATGADRHDVAQPLPPLDAGPNVGGRRGRPRRRFDRVRGERAYDSDPHRREVRRRHAEPVLARRNTPHGSGLGATRRVVERAHAWLHQPRRLKLRYENGPTSTRPCSNCPAS